MTEIWEDANKIAEKWLEMTKLEIFFVILIIFFDIMNMRITKYTILTLLVLMLLIPIYKRKQYDKRRTKQNNE